MLRFCTFMTDTALHTNDILQRCMLDLVLNKIAITVNAKYLLQFLLNPTGFCFQ